MSPGPLIVAVVWWAVGEKSGELMVQKDQVWTAKSFGGLDHRIKCPHNNKATTTA